MQKKFISLIPIKIIREAEEEFKNNQPRFVARNKKDKVSEFLANKYLEYWWKNGGWKKVLEFLKRS
jgi:hypothetical protein